VPLHRQGAKEEEEKEEEEVLWPVKLNEFVQPGCD